MCHVDMDALGADAAAWGGDPGEFDPSRWAGGGSFPRAWSRSRHCADGVAATIRGSAASGSGSAIGDEATSGDEDTSSTRLARLRLPRTKTATSPASASPAAVAATAWAAVLADSVCMKSLRH